MSLFKTVTVQGGRLVERDEKGNVLRKSTPLSPTKPPIVSWRAQLRQLTNGGMDTLARLANIANGVPQRAVLEDGTYTEWTVPTISEQRQALQFLAEFQLGKSVTQNEIVRAEAEADEHAQLSAMSDEALRDAARPFLERVEKKRLTEGDESDE